MQNISASDILEKLEELSVNSWISESTTEYLEYLTNEIIIKNIYGENIDLWKTFKITPLHKVDKNCVFQIVDNIEEQYYFDRTEENFSDILKTNEEKKVFNDFLDELYSIDSLEELIEKNHLSKVDKNSPLYTLIHMIYKNNSLIHSLTKILNDLWINININPSLELNENIEKHIRNVQKSLIELAIWNNHSYVEEDYKKRKIH